MIIKFDVGSSIVKCVQDPQKHTCRGPNCMAWQRLYLSEIVRGNDQVAKRNLVKTSWGWCGLCHKPSEHELTVWEKSAKEGRNAAKKV